MRLRRSRIILVPSGRAPFGQHQEPRPLRGSNFLNMRRVIVTSSHPIRLSDFTLNMRRVTGDPEFRTSDVEPSRRSRFLVLTKSSAAFGDENARACTPAWAWLRYASLKWLHYIRHSSLSMLTTDLKFLAHNLRRRKNYDSQINEHGKSLHWKTCCELRIVHGRTSGDSFGRITCHSPKGISTVDYFIVSHAMLSLIGNFIV